MGARHSLTVPPESAGERLDRLLARALPGLSRTRLQSLIRDGHVTVNGEGARPSRPAAAGDEILVEVPDAEPFDLAAEAIPLHVVFEDEDFLVIDKPAGMVVHPGAGVAQGTLLNALLHHAPSIEGVGGVQRPGLVHRLDRGTTGLLVVAKTDAAYASLRAQISSRSAGRRYLGVVWGRPPRDEGEVDAPMGRDARHRQRMAVRPGGRPALTRYRVLRAFDLASFLELVLGTGRTHQIRVHMASQGCPVLGDATYGGRSQILERFPPGARRFARRLLDVMPRQALHAATLAFDHPRSGERLVFESPLPEDVRVLLATLEQGPAGSGGGR